MLSFGLIAQMMVYGINNFPILAVPLFLLTGAIMNVGGISDRIFAFANALVGHIRGGLAHVNIIASFIFSGMSARRRPMWRASARSRSAPWKKRLRQGFQLCRHGASATIGPVVPPSIPLILYGVIANASVTKLFIGGLLPGFMMVVTLMIFCGVMAKRRATRRARPSA